MIPCLQGYPGVILELTADGVVRDSNGRLEQELDAEVRGRAFASLLDASSSLEKWERLLGQARPGAFELVLHSGETLAEPHVFTLVRDADVLWLMEHPRDPRLDELRRQVDEVNADLAETQRALVREKARLSQSLAEVERLAHTVQEQNRELERSNDDLDQFAHVASHDLKAPLRAIRYYVDFLEEDLADTLNEQAREYLQRLRNRADHASAMIDGVLRYARTGRGHAALERIDTGALARDVVELLDPRDDARVEILPGMPTLLTERAPLQQVLLNLVGNALKHARRADPRVRVGALQGDDGAYDFFVEDNGPGIAPRLHERIWDLFHTLDPTDPDSTGIGLAVVRKLVEAQGGTARVESPAGGGAVFRFRWPAAAPR